MSEIQLQADFIRMQWNEFPELRHLLWNIPNDAIGEVHGLKDVLRVNELKATGLLPGVWDMGCIWKGQYNIIETKLPGNTLTTDRIVKRKNGSTYIVFGQLEYGRRMAANGVCRHIYHNIDEGRRILTGIVTGIAKDGTFMKPSEM